MEICKTVADVRDITDDMVYSGIKIKTPKNLIGKTSYNDWLSDLQDMEDSNALKVSITFDGKFLILKYL